MLGLWSWTWAIRAFKAVWASFVVLLHATDTWLIYVVMFLACVVFRLLAVPFLGAALQAGSDTFRGWRDRGRDPLPRQLPPGR